VGCYLVARLVGVGGEPDHRYGPGLQWCLLRIRTNRCSCSSFAVVEAYAKRSVRQLEQLGHKVALEPLTQTTREVLTRPAFHTRLFAFN
jgi:hypothetical protein